MKKYLYFVVNIIFNLFPIKKRKIFFLSYYGSQYGCNPKYLSEYMTQNCKDWIVVWGFTNPDRYQISGINKVKYLSFKYFYELCTSQVFVTNYRMTEHYKKRKGQLYVQTWHSSLRLKKIEGDIEENLPTHYVKMAKEDSKKTDILLSGCQFSTEVFRRAFWYFGKIAQTGTPREDLMFSYDKERCKEVKAKLGLSYGKKVLLYAPTFRKDYSLESYDIDFDRLLVSLSTKYGGEWIILLRLHPHLLHFSERLVAGNTLIQDVTAYDDIQELLFVSDMVISDYSSLIFDFALTYRPCFLYTSDLETYTRDDRSLYFNIKDLPFPISQNNDELNKNIRRFDEKKYKQEVSAFLHSIGSYESGHACENVISFIIDELNNGKK